MKWNEEIYTLLVYLFIYISYNDKDFIYMTLYYIGLYQIKI